MTTTEYVNNDALLYSPVLEYKNGLLKREYLADGYIDGGRAKYELVSLGGGVRVFDDNGVKIGSVQYDSFGNTLGTEGSGNQFDTWKGQFFDPDTGLVYIRNRWYDPITGRWLSNDPIGISGGLNQYVFSANNPVNFIDPFGLCEDGTAFANRYYTDLMRSPMNPFYVLGPEFLGSDWLDIRELESGSTMYEYNGNMYRPDQMGNIAAGYAGAKAWGLGPTIIFVMGVAELATGGGLDAAVGSWSANLQGMVDAIRENPGQVIMNTILGPVVGPLLNWGVHSTP